ncbi:zinc ribbon domain-containing protein [Deinococcus sp. KSM4-11]|uniref:zinc ribbon domain-containing protein n=1 Tax=Deinococcus sp. KSM4-11 TaxID=2568654 RepID=UPI001454DA7F|nr:zinc ribbon domain-containing protein [Deinococcus sp. KSM4-11]
MASAVRAAQLTVHTALLHHAAGHPLSLVDAAPGRAAPLPRLAPDARVWPPTVTQQRLVGELQHLRGSLGWPSMPASALGWAVSSVAQVWRAPALRPRRVSDLTTLDALPPPVIALRNVLPVDEVTLEILGLGDHALVEADLYLLPTPFAQALWHRHHARLGREAERLTQAEAAFFSGGAPQPAADALRLRARYASVGLLLDGRSAPPAPPPGAPTCRDQVVLRDVGTPTAPRWEVVWSFHVPAPSRWLVDDVLGVDPGQRHTWAYASAAMHGVIPRPHAGAWVWPALDPGPGITPHGERRARAWARRALFERMRPGHEQLIALALMHRVCAVEDVAWGGFRWHGSYADYAGDPGIGIRAALDWLTALAPVHGVELIRTPPAYSTRTCSRCGRVRPRPGSGRPFTCPCGQREAADINAARNHRQRALQMLAARRDG